MRICLVGKYPPIEGQVSTLDYWLARGLAERGHVVTVVTNGDEAESGCRVVRDEAYDCWYEPSALDSGGHVRVLASAPYGRDQFYVPAANPFVTKLAALALRAVREHHAELLFSTYLEPYGVAAHIAAACTRVPHVATHSGSDIARLARNDDLRDVYAEVAGASTFVAKNRLAESLAGPRAVRPVRPKPYWPPEALFHPSTVPLDVDGFLMRHRDVVRNELRWHIHPFDPTHFTFGFYGKLTEAKGVYDLVCALALLKADGLPFTLLLMSRWRTGEDRLRAAILDADLEDRTWLLPFVANWDVPRFVCACDAVCHLERDWPTGVHVSIVPKEVTACGVCLVISEEVRGRPTYREVLQDGTTCVAVADPKDAPPLAERLRRLVAEPQRAREIGEAGRRAMQRTGAHREFVDSWEAVLVAAATADGRCTS